ncbi:addiction module protein [Azospirillum rugosum]|uniref:Addiction module component (TIGR02574 family) n=1 Tax=Azospirillum rugosum TaxID=416170 RepID=A0ABS4ST12_9PROT|nr:addiction module protein [Azospirillum rugosum]MBP2294505.1 putative addiction module component (TIGR02574 family) [Azospirillum rugosum]MDQ0529010.1 putative addiction module component (TIGR02574 family) [Azospirillum rugosum]
MSIIDFSHLSLQERLDLISELCDSLDQQQVPLTPAQDAELDRRIATADEDLADSVPWESIRTEIARRFG